MVKQGAATLKAVGSALTDKLGSLGGLKGNNKAVADQLNLSMLSRQLELLNTESGLGQGDEGGEMSLQGLENLKQRGKLMANVLQMKLDNFQGNLVKSLQANGIDTSKPISLQDGGEEGLLLGGDHPDAAKIKALFENDQNLSRQFQEIASLSKLVRGIDRLNTETGAGGAHSPIAAYQQQVQSGNTKNDERFTAVVQGAGATFTYE